ncbi:unnamed protein product [Trichobilharzia regenti]|nr:unnamed protein product [Trichobilharzia regenti]
MKASELRIDEKLDSELQRSCEHFDDKAYSTVQRAFELLGSTQTTFAQLQMHYVAAIQRRSFNLVQVHLDTPSSHMIDISGDNSDHSSYSDMCQSKSASKSPQLNCNPFSSDTLLMKSKQHKTKLKDGEIDSNISNNSNNNMTTGDNDSAIVITDRNSPLSKSSSVTNDDHGCDPELARQWHDYVACKLDSGRSRIWSEIISRIEPILSVVGLVARDMTFDQIASLLTTVNQYFA